MKINIAPAMGKIVACFFLICSVVVNNVYSLQLATQQSKENILEQFKHQLAWRIYWIPQQASWATRLFEANGAIVVFSGRTAHGAILGYCSVTFHECIAFPADGSGAWVQSESFPLNTDETSAVASFWRELTGDSAKSVDEKGQPVVSQPPILLNVKIPLEVESLDMPMPHGRKNPRVMSEANQLLEKLACTRLDLTKKVSSCQTWLEFASIQPSDPIWFISRTCSEECSQPSLTIFTLLRSRWGWAVTTGSIATGPVTYLNNMSAKIRAQAVLKLNAKK